MNIWMIWTTDPDGGSHSLITAIDDSAKAADDTAWLAALSTAEEAHGARHIRVVKTYIDMDNVRRAFEVPTV